MFGGPEISYHQTYSARDWLSTLRTPYTTQNLQRKNKKREQLGDRRNDGESNCNSGDGTGQMSQPWMFMMMMMMMIKLVFTRFYITNSVFIVFCTTALSSVHNLVFKNTDRNLIHCVLETVQFIT
jgi:hypothetical protein